MLTGQNFVADFHDQRMALVVEPAGGVIGIRRRLFQDRIGRDHFARDQIGADAEMLQRALSLRAP